MENFNVREFTIDEIDFLEEAIREAEKEYLEMIEKHIEDIAKLHGEGA